MQHEASSLDPPAIEIEVRVHGASVALVAYFPGQTATDWDVVVGVTDHDLVEQYASACRDAATRLVNASFRSVPGEENGGSEPSSNIPF